MSQGKSDSDLDDVLSSIRRLVSTSLGQAPGRSDGAAAPSELEEAARRAAQELNATKQEAREASNGSEVPHMESDGTNPGETPQTLLLSEDQRLPEPPAAASENEDPPFVFRDADAPSEPTALDLEPQTRSDGEQVLSHASLPDPNEAIEWAAPGVEGDEVLPTPLEVANDPAPVVSLRPEAPQTSAADVSPPVVAASVPVAEPSPVPPALDEDEIRDLVAETIRDELRGALGEKITRTVRQLVRREIQRALALREFDHDPED
ncbi:MAG: hypothetical protein AAFY03_02665 [Pseudomonadota bacterium]